MVEIFPLGAYGSSFRRILHSSLTPALPLVILFLLSELPSLQNCDLHPPSTNQAFNCHRKRAPTRDGSIVTPEPDPGPLVTLGKEGPFLLPSRGLAVFCVSLSACNLLDSSEPAHLQMDLPRYSCSVYSTLIPDHLLSKISILGGTSVSLGEIHNHPVKRIIIIPV